jgi:site-specific DNA recombinase
MRSLGFQLIEDRFDDEGYSGTTLDRPALQRLLGVIRAGGIEQLVIYRLDRLSRNLRHFTTLFEELREHNVALEVVTAPGLGPAALDKLMLNVLASFAEFERDIAASRIAEARAHLKAHGRRIAGAIPFGYGADPHTKQLVVCEEEANAVVRMFHWAAAGVTPSVIASYANALRWITGGGNPWTARQVLSILRNHVYAGLVINGFALRPGCHPPLIDQDLYHQVQNVISGRRNRIPGKRGSGVGITWILRGLLSCGECGRLMSTHIVRAGPVLRCYYRCRSTTRGREACKGVMASAYEIETAVLSVIRASPKLTSKEQCAAVKEMVRGIVYDARSGTVRIELIKPLDGSAHAEAEATDRRAGTAKRKSDPHRC